MKIQILSDKVLTKSIPARGERAAMQFNEQVAAILDNDGGFPKPFKISLEAGEHPYRPGMYTFDPASFVTDEYERLKIGRGIKLIAIDEKVPPPVKAS
ncbi:single-stranded DNA-binding protein [Stenotrophomonas terrae]|uniref:single-stranded DNA-binding protein n=1 Tax=Stenotrophomonas terrae TaxID=405446 RepID=UPI00320A46DA